MSRARLHLFLDGEHLHTLAPPSVIAPRDWLLGVIAIQATVEDTRIVARLRAHLTGGGAARQWQLPERATLQILLGDSARAPPCEAFAEEDTGARLSLRHRGRTTTARLPHDHLHEQPAPRAFGHVYCRWLRDGRDEPCCDLTAFLRRQPGEKFERLVAAPVAPGEFITYTFAAA